MNLPAGWKSPCLPSSFPARTTWHWFAKSSSWSLERKRNTPLQEEYMLLSSRPVWETLGLTSCCNAHYPFTLPALGCVLPSVNSLNELSGIFFGQDPSLLPELGNACWTPGIVRATVKTSVYHREALNNWTTVSFKACFCTPFESTSPASALKLMDDHSEGRQAQEKLAPEQLEIPHCISTIWLCKAPVPAAAIHTKGMINPQHTKIKKPRGSSSFK